MATKTTDLTGRLLDATGAAIANEYVYFRLKTSGADQDVTPEEVFAAKPIEFQTDANGDISGTLWVNGESEIESVYRVTTKNDRITPTDVIIPTAVSGGTIDIATLLIDHVALGSSTQQSSVYDAAIQRSNHTGDEDLNGTQKVIWDADGDTYTWSDSTDDTIKYVIGGTTELTLTAAKADNLDDIAALTPTDEAVLRGNGTDWVIATNLRVDAGTANSGTEMGTGVANGARAVAEGNLTTAGGDDSHAEGVLTTASGSSAHSEGISTQAIGFAAHAEGSTTIASGDYSHAEGGGSIASGDYSSATGRRAKAIHDGARVEADSQNADVSSTTTDQYTARFQNGYRFLEGGQSVEITTVTTTTSTLTASEYIVLVDDDTAGSAVTITLPAAASHPGRIYSIKKIGSTANVVVDGNASETIDGATTATLTTQYESITIISNGTNWFII